MIRRLGEADRASVTALLSASPQLNLYLLGNLEANGFDADFCEFFGDVEGRIENGGGNGRVRGVINRYTTGWTVYGEPGADWARLGAVVDAHAVVADRLQDNPGGVASFMPYLRRYRAASLTEDHLMELPEGALQPQAAREGFVVRKATLADLDGLVGLFADAGDMARTPMGVERPLRDRRVWLALREGEVVSAALTNAETSTLAMIGGVYTAPAWRGHGLSQAVCSGLCAELMATGRQPILYWHNPAAGRVYTKLGFRPIGTWRSVRLTVV
jgi:GNAT superfamily N-acetyltransferase